MDNIKIHYKDMAGYIKDKGLWPVPKGLKDLRIWLRCEDEEDSPYTVEEWQRLMLERKVIKTTQTRKQSCPVCGLFLTATTSYEGEYPKPGDVTVCVKCRKVLVFGEAMDLELAGENIIAEVKERLEAVNRRLGSKYTLLQNGILCHKCGKTSFNKKDIENLYCGNCHEFLG